MVQYPSLQSDFGAPDCAAILISSGSALIPFASAQTQGGELARPLHPYRARHHAPSRGGSLGVRKASAPVVIGRRIDAAAPNYEGRTTDGPFPEMSPDIL